MKIEGRAVGRKATQRKRGLLSASWPTTSVLARNYIPAIEANSRQPGPKLQGQLVKYFGCRFDELVEVVLIGPETGREHVLQPKKAD
jgi:hypothetical protein